MPRCHLLVQEVVSGKPYVEIRNANKRSDTKEVVQEDRYFIIGPELVPAPVLVPGPVLVAGLVLVPGVVMLWFVDGSGEVVVEVDGFPTSPVPGTLLVPAGGTISGVVP